jgi:hypothetical protein
MKLDSILMHQASAFGLWVTAGCAVVAVPTTLLDDIFFWNQ